MKRRIQFVAILTISTQSAWSQTGSHAIDGVKGTINYQEEIMYKGISLGPICTSEDGDHFALVERTKEPSKMRVVVDGRVGTLYDNVTDLLLSRDGATASYVATTENSQQVVVNGLESKRWDAVANILRSRDDKHIAYSARTGDKWRIVLDGKEGPEFDHIFDSQFAPNASRFAYIGRNNIEPDKTISVGGKRGAPEFLVGNCGAGLNVQSACYPICYSLEVTECAVSSGSAACEL